MHVALLAPVSPRGLARHLYAGERERIVGDGDYGPAPTAIALALLDAGVRVTVVSHRRGFPELRLRGDRLDFIQVGSRARARDQVFDWWAVERSAMVDAIREASPDVVHAHWTYEWALAGLQTGLPTVVTVRDAPLTILRYQFDSYRIIRAAMAYWVRIRGRNTLMTAASPYMAESWRRQMLWRKSMPIIPNIAPQDVERTAARAKHPLVVEVADAGRRKNVKGLLRAFAWVRRTLPDAELRILGNGLGRDGDLAAWAARMELDRGVHFLGKLDREEVGRHLSQAWIHAHAAIEESFGNTLLEAMALDTAIVAGARSAAVPWVLGGGSAGYLCDVQNPQAFGHAMLTMLCDEEKRSEYIASASELIDGIYSPREAASAHVKLYGGLLDSLQALGAQGGDA